jgi:transcription-repair coupling factor (superfamily II helicase)
MSSQTLSNVLIVSITPYFLEKENFWFQENLSQVLEAQKTQNFFQDNIIYLSRGQNYNLSQFLRKLDEMGYEKVLEILEPGEFSQRGGVIGVFPINLSYAVRFDFLGNEIEEISRLPIETADEKIAKNILKKKLKSQKLFSDLKGIKPGNYLVHLDHGIAQFSGVEKIGNEDSYYVLEYAMGDKLFVPLGLERKLSRYVGFTQPNISRLGSMVWQQTKKRIKESAEKLAKELLEIYAKREIATRPPYLPDNEIDEKLAESFKYEETPDQLEAISEIKKDLEADKPMDRILCGDVGFGKTEVALRTMVRAVKSGYQAAMIVPTTILAHQHFHNFEQRLKNLPVRMALLSRLQSEKEQKIIVEKLKSGQIDILLGTHRILSKDVEFKNLSLLVIDDEQRFGVKQKEKLKKMRESLDILSLSATPIPRTLYLALASMKNISVIQTPPAGRLPVETCILPFSKKIIEKAIENEIKRKGQVYFLHNRVETIEAVKKDLSALVPTARFGVGHGQLSEKELVKVMDDFQNKKIDVLIATTIIENGIDLPNANTIIVDDAARLGLAQAYQIRGRIGRSHIQAFSYFFHGKNLSEKAQLRLDALKEFEELGSGYQIAMRDLEIRGAGNILGREQSGSINKVGLNLYCQMLSEAVEKLKNSVN